jgi:hypothetical protein
MSKRIGIVFLVAASVALNPLKTNLLSEETSQPMTEEVSQELSPASEQETHQQAEQTVGQETESEPVKEVQKTSSNEKAEKRYRWIRGIGLALVAIAVATVAIILASSNNGKKSS